MDPASRSCPNHHGPNGCHCLLLQEQQHQLHHPSAALPSHDSLNPATTPFPGSYFHDFHGNTVYSHLHLPSQLQFHFASVVQVSLTWSQSGHIKSVD
jgi:hypothetical protein